MSTPRASIFTIQCAAMKTVGERIRQAREAKHYSAERLALEVGYKTQSGIANIENRANSSGGHRLKDIARVLGVSVDWLLGGPDCDTVHFLPQAGGCVVDMVGPVGVRQDVPELYPVKLSARWPFSSFGYDAWMRLSADERDAFEGKILLAVTRAKQTRTGS